MAPRAPPSPVAALLPLYFVQGMPYGFQGKALKLHLTDQGVSLTAISLAGLLALPWLLKPLIAPWVDRFGTRHQWILPLTFGLVVLQLAAAWLDPVTQLVPLLGLLLAMNALTAAQDVAVDGLAVDLLSGAALGTGNGAQVAGYKVGMLVGGSALIVVFADWGHVFLTMAACTATGVLLHLYWVRDLAAPTLFPPRPDVAVDRGLAAVPAPRGATFAHIGRTLAAAVRAPGGLLLIGFIASYKVGESISDDLWKPYLQRGLGTSKETLALWDATWGMGFSIAGSTIGGLLAARYSPLRAVTWAMASRLIPAVACLACVVWPPDPPALIAVTCVEELTGGALTPAMFALMMGSVDRRIGATHFTVLAAVEVAGKAPGGLLAGALAEGVGWQGAFSLALGLTAVALCWLPVVRSLQTERLR